MSDTALDIGTDNAKATPVTRPTSIVVSVLKRPLGLISVLWLTIVVFVAAFAPVIAPHDPYRQDLLAIKRLPSAEHLLGTDAFGRDILSRLMIGSTSTVIGIIEALCVAAVLGVTLGVVAGYFGRWADRAIGMFIEIVMTLPNIIVLMVILTVFKRDMSAAMITVGVLGSAGTARIVRSATLGVRNELYIDAARICGLSDLKIIWRHVLPRITGPITVQLSVFAAITILIQTGISFLGLGIQPPFPSWGGMIHEASVAMNDFPWLLVPSGLIVAMTILAFGLLGDSIRDSFAARWTMTAPQRKPVAAPQSESMAPAPFAETAALSVRDLKIVTYKGGTEKVLVDKISFDVAGGETMGIVGESGSGKTLTSLALIGLLPAGVQVVSGAMRYRGVEYDLRDVKSLAALRGPDVGMIFQEPMAALDPCFTVGHYLTEVIRLYNNVTRAEARQKAIEALREVQIPDPEAVLKKYPHQISGGMAQRIGIARALIPEPLILLADEPTTALDVTVQAEILDLLREAQSRRHMAKLFVTHDWGVVADICDQAMVMYHGKLMETAPVAALFSNPTDAYTRALLAANPHGAEVGKRLPTIKDILSEAGQ